jgi:hypothetical protein
MDGGGLSRREFLRISAAGGLTAAFAGSISCSGPGGQHEVSPLLVDSPLGRRPIDTAGSAVGMVRLDVSRSYAGVPELLRDFINNANAKAWSAITTKIDYTCSVNGTYIPPGLCPDKLMVYDLNRLGDDMSRGRAVPVPDGVNFTSIYLHKAIVGGEPADADDRRAHPGCILVNVLGADTPESCSRRDCRAGCSTSPSFRAHL